MFRLKTTFEGETVYFMNVCCITHQPTSAETYETEDEALRDMQYFKNMFHRDDLDYLVEEFEPTQGEN